MNTTQVSPWLRPPPVRLHTKYKCSLALGGAPVNFLILNNMVPYILKTTDSPNCLAAVLRFPLPHGPQRIILWGTLALRTTTKFPHKEPQRPTHPFQRPSKLGHPSYPSSRQGCGGLILC